jgi:uncharacterized repeat protein (TIGR03803 family)
MKNQLQRTMKFSVRNLHFAVKPLAMAAIMMTIVLAGNAVHAQTYKVLHSFTGGADGANPLFDQMVLIGGNLYGVTSAGGASNDGTVFKLNVHGQETVIHSFSGADGNSPEGGLIRDSAGNLYGVTQLGGNPTQSCSEPFEPNGCGTVFEVSSADQFSVLHSFAGADGANPVARLTRGSNGALYGTTSAGGQSPSCPGQNYEQGCGTVFEMTNSGGTWSESVLYNFAGGSKSFSPIGYVMIAGGKLYGTTDSGNGSPCDSNVCGTVYELAMFGGTWTETIPHAFVGGSDGAFPEGGLVRDSAGNFYGTTYDGGTDGFGTIFKMDSAGQKTTLYNFTGTEGAYPAAALTRDSSGNLYGTTTEGGPSKVGTVFQLDTSNTFTVLHNFTGGKNDGAYPYGNLLLAGKNLYGTTNTGGASNDGTVFEVSK